MNEQRVDSKSRSRSTTFGLTAIPDSHKPKQTGYGDMDQRQIFLRDILTVVFKRKALIVLFVIVVFGVVVVGNYAWPPTYESAAKVRLMRGREVSQTDPTVTRSSAGVTMVQMTPEDVNSEIELIYSDDVLKQSFRNAVSIKV